MEKTLLIPILFGSFMASFIYFFGQDWKFMTIKKSSGGSIEDRIKKIELSLEILFKIVGDKINDKNQSSTKAKDSKQRDVEQKPQKDDSNKDTERSVNMSDVEKQTDVSATEQNANEEEM